MTLRKITDNWGHVWWETSTRPGKHYRTKGQARAAEERAV